MKKEILFVAHCFDKRPMAEDWQKVFSDEHSAGEAAHWHCDGISKKEAENTVARVEWYTNIPVEDDQEFEDAFREAELADLECVKEPAGVYDVNVWGWNLQDGSLKDHDVQILLNDGVDDGGELLVIVESTNNDHIEGFYTNPDVCEDVDDALETLHDNVKTDIEDGLSKLNDGMYIQPDLLEDLVNDVIRYSGVVDRIKSYWEQKSED